MDDITKKLLQHEVSTVRSSMMPTLEDHVSEVHANTHTTRAHLMRLGVTHAAFLEGRVTVALSPFGMLFGRLAMDCHLSYQATTDYVRSLHSESFPPASISDEVVAHIGVSAAQQLERLGRFALGEIRRCVEPDSDEWAVLSFLMTFLRATMLGTGTMDTPPGMD